MSRMKYLVSVAFIVSGAVIFTYASTRAWTTRLVLTNASEHVRAYLEIKNLYPGPSNRDVLIDEDTQLESKRLLGDVWGVGGRYYWWNDAIPYWGLGVLLLFIGVLVPFYRGRGLVNEFRR